MKNKGLFIVFEGHDGSGKSTQAKLLQESLIKKFKRQVVLTSEPTGVIRHELLYNKNITYTPSQQMILFFTDRILNLEKNIKPNLKNNIDVICDRYVDSTLAYQVHGNGNSYNDFISMLRLSKILTPDIIIKLIVSTEKGLERAKKRGELDKFESKNNSFQKRVYDSFVNNNVFNNVINLVVNTSDLSINEVHNLILNKISMYFN